MATSPAKESDDFVVNLPLDGHHVPGPDLKNHLRTGKLVPLAGGDDRGPTWERDRLKLLSGGGASGAIVISSSSDIIIAGDGRVGFQTAELLADRDDASTITERVPDSRSCVMTSVVGRRRAARAARPY